MEAEGYGKHHVPCAVCIRRQLQGLPVSSALPLCVFQMGRGIHNANGSAAENHGPARGKSPARTWKINEMSSGSERCGNVVSIRTRDV